MQIRILSFAILVALATPAFADDAAKKCKGELFVINGKNVCMVAVDPEDYYRIVDTAGPAQAQPAPGSLVITPQEKRGPYVKFSGSLLADDRMGMDILLDRDAYTYERTDRLSRTESSTATSDVTHVPWGLSAQWSPDGQFWVEAGWERPSIGLVALDTSRYARIYASACREGQPCRDRFGIDEHVRHRFTADDFSLALKWDVIPESRYASILLGAGVHYRKLRDRDTLTRVTYDPFDPDVVSEVTPVTVRTAQTRGFGQLDLELYPAGKDRFVGVGITARLLGDGRKEQQFTTGTNLDENIIIGIQPGWYDVTARLIVRF